MGGRGSRSGGGGGKGGGGGGGSRAVLVEARAVETAASKEFDAARAASVKASARVEQAEAAWDALPSKKRPKELTQRLREARQAQLKTDERYDNAFAARAASTKRRREAEDAD